MKFTAKQYAEALYAVVSETAPGAVDKVLDNFAAFLRENSAFGLLEEIEREYLRLGGMRLAEVTTAKPLEPAEEAAVIEKLNAYVKGKVQVRKKVDAGLLGGIVVRMDDELMDASIRKSLHDLKNELIK